MRLSRPSRTPALLALLALACGRGDAPGGGTPGGDALDRDLTLAASAATPLDRRDAIAFADTAVSAQARPNAAPIAAPIATPEAPPPPPRPTPRRVAEAPPAAPTTAAAPAPADSAPADLPTPEPTTVAAGLAAVGGHTFGVGTTMALATASPICQTSSRPGDRFVATLREPVTAADGTPLPAGANVVVELSSLLPGDGGRGQVELIARAISIDGFVRPIHAEVARVDAMLDRRRVPPPAGTPSAAGKVGRGAMTGAVLGRVFGGRGAKGTIIGAAAGAAAGAIGARGNATYESCLPAGSPISLRLTGALTIGA